MIFPGSRAKSTQKWSLEKVLEMEHLNSENSFSRTSSETIVGILLRFHPTHRLPRTGYCSGTTPLWVGHITHYPKSKIQKRINGRISRTVRDRPIMWPRTRKPSSLCIERSQARLVWISLSGSNKQTESNAISRTFMPRHPVNSRLTRGLPVRNAFPPYRTSYFISIID